VHPALPDALMRLTAVAGATGTTTAAAREAVQICQEALGEDLGVSLVLGEPLCPEVLAASTSTAQWLDGAQLTAGQGPTVDCVATGEVVVSDDLWADGRWERLARRVPVPGVRAVVAAPLRSGEQALGALTVSGAFPASAGEVQVLASAVTAVVNELAVRSEVEEVTAAMERALSSRAVIDLAKGIVMADKRCGPDEAFQHLVSLSSLQHRKLREVAAALVRETGGDSPH
jgi:GAF domain-containing protein